MILPDALRGALEAVLGPVGHVRPVGGGCVCTTLRVQAGGREVFVKSGAEAPIFRAEADGLGALRGTAGGDLVIPEVLALGDEPPFLALEWLEPAPGPAGFAERLGRGLAALHRPQPEGWGWPGDNFIGTLPQGNAPAGSWAEFWRARRLEPQLRRAADAGLRPGRPEEWEALFAVLPAWLDAAEEDGSSLLHGDLWSGNVLATGRGPALVDPAVHRGHGEVDLAMAALFGGFPAAFFAAYAEARPLREGSAARRLIYQLYYLLVHVNLFGGGYLSQTAGVLRRSLACR